MDFETFQTNLKVRIFFSTVHNQNDRFVNTLHYIFERHGLMFLQKKWNSVKRMCYDKSSIFFLLNIVQIPHPITLMLIYKMLGFLINSMEGRDNEQ